MLGLKRLFSRTPATPDLRPHALLAEKPELDDAAFAELLASIRRIGLHVPIVVIGDEIVDGRARYKACLLLGITPTLRPYEATASDTLAELIDGLNLHRRMATTANDPAEPVKLTQRGAQEKCPAYIEFVDRHWVAHGRAPTASEFCNEFPAVPRSTARGYIKRRPRPRLVM